MKARVEVIHGSAPSPQFDANTAAAVGYGLPDVDLDNDGLLVTVAGVRFEFGTSRSHPGHVILAVTDTNGEEDIWRFRTSEYVRSAEPVR